jgi:hypothetical protein
MTLLKYPTWGIMNEQQTIPYYLSDELASKPSNHN